MIFDKFRFHKVVQQHI